MADRLDELDSDSTHVEARAAIDEASEMSREP
jgi:hypothetical protein